MTLKAYAILAIGVWAGAIMSGLVYSSAQTIGSAFVSVGRIAGGPPMNKKDERIEALSLLMMERSELVDRAAKTFKFHLEALVEDLNRLLEEWGPANEL